MEVTRNRASEGPPSTDAAARFGLHGQVPRPHGAGLPLVLLVDDTPDNLLALEAILRRDDVEIVTATSGRVALDAILQRDVAVAIIDVMMPDMDGFELAELIRGVEQTRRVPIIFVTEGGKEYRRFAGYETGAIDFLFKPLDPSALRAKVDVLVTLAKQRLALDRALADAEHARKETEVLLRLAQATSQSEKPQDIFDPALDAVRELFGAERSAVLLFDESERMRFRAWRGLSETYRTAVDGHSPWSRAERDPRPILIADVVEDAAMAPYRSVFAAERIRAIGFVPLVAGGALVGKFMLYWNQKRTFSEHDTALAVAIASQVAEMIERTRLREAERNNARLLQGVLAGIEEGFTVQDRTGKLIFANASAARLVGFDSPEAMLSMPAAEILARFKLFDEHGAPLPPDKLPSRAVLAGEKSMAVLVQYDAGDADRRWSHVRAYPVLDADGKLARVINVFHDVTKERREEARRGAR